MIFYNVGQSNGKDIGLQEVEGTGIQGILNAKDKLFGGKLLGDGLIRVSDARYYHSLKEYHAENPKGPIDKQKATVAARSYVLAKVDMRSNTTEKELIKRIEKQRKETKKLYRLDHLPDVLAYYNEDKTIATVMIETPFNAAKYILRCKAVVYKLNAVSKEQLNLNTSLAFGYQLTQAISLPKLKSDTIFYSAIGKRPESTDNAATTSSVKQDAVLPEFDDQPQSMDEFFNRLKAVSKAWHAAHDSTDQKTGKIIPAKMSIRDTLDLLERYVNFYYLYDINGDTSRLDQSPIWVMDYDKGIYQTNDVLINQMIQALNRDIIKQTERNDMIKTLKADRVIKIHPLTRSIHPEYIPMGNGVYDLRHHTFRKYDLKKDFFISKTDVIYNPNATVEPEFEIPMTNGKVQKWKLTRDWFNKVATDINGFLDKKKLRLLFQGVFLAMTNSYNCRKVLFCINDGKSGTSKSTYLELCEAMVGQDNYAVVNVTEWGDPQAMNAVRGKNLLVGDDFDTNSPIYNYAAFKNLASDGPVRTKLLYTNSYSAPLHVFTIQVGNGMPTFRNPDNAILKRIRILRFDHFFSTDNPFLRIIKDEFIHDKRLLEWLAYTLLNMFEFKDTKEVIDTSESRHEIRNVASEQDSLQAFISGRMTDLVSRRIPAGMMYVYYYNSSLADGFPESQILTKNKFIKQFQLQQSDWIYIPGNARVRDEFNPDDTQTTASVMAQVPSPKQREFRSKADGDGGFSAERYRGTVFENKSNPSLADIQKQAQKEGEEMRQKIANGEYTHDDVIKDADNSDKINNFFVNDKDHEAHAQAPFPDNFNNPSQN